jgi:outer membrane protein assembly factor BamB
MSRSRIILSLLVTWSALALPSRAEDWMQWRGPDFNGSADARNLPATWEDGKNVLWTTPMPGQAGATPVVAGNRVFLTSVDDQTGKLLAMAVHLESGEVLWRRPCGKNRKASGGNTMASPSPVTDGRHVWFLFGTGGLYGFTVEGDPLWTREIQADHGPLSIKFGYSCSPLLLDGRLYIPVLRNRNPYRYVPKRQRPKEFEQQESLLLCIDAESGKDLWKHIRPVPEDVTDESTEAYITPIPVTHEAHTQILLVGQEHVTAHDPKTGKELWRWAFQPEDRKVWQRVVSCPTPGDGKVFVTRPQNRPMFALDLTPGEMPAEKRSLWRYGRHTSDVAQPLLYEGRLYVVQGKRHVISCLKPETGEVVWEQKLEVKGPVRASPLGADGKVYLISRKGTVTVLEAGDTFKQLSHFEMGQDPCHSSIVAAQGRLLVRTGEQLYCLGK